MSVDRETVGGRKSNGGERDRDGGERGRALHETRGKSTDRVSMVKNSKGGREKEVKEANFGL